MRALGLSTFLMVFAGASVVPSLCFAKSAVAVAESQATNAALAVAFDAQGQLRAKVCAAKAAKSCDPSDGVLVAVPEEAARSVSRAKLGAVRIAPRQALVWVSIPEEANGPRWDALISAPLAGTTPVVLFSNWVGLSRGEYGAREGHALIISDADAQGVRRVVRGNVHEDLGLCGREAVLDPEVLDPKDLSFRPAKMQRLASEERARATPFRAERVLAPTTGMPQVLRARAASSAVGNPAELTDGNPETTWSENRGGDGRGEFVVLRAPANLPLSGFEFVVRPPTRAVEGGTAPSEFWLLTNSELYRVAMPEDAWRYPGARYRVLLGRSVVSDCVALVTEKGIARVPKARVTFAELNALSDASQLNPNELAGRLLRGGEESRSAAAALQLLGDAGYQAVIHAFAGFDEGARRAGLDVLDGAPCETGIETYIDVATGPHEELKRRARERLKSCALVSGPALLRRLGTAPRATASALAEELGAVSPQGAVTGVLPLLERANGEQRLLLRSVLARVSRTALGAEAVRRALADPTLRAQPALELLRSLGDRAARFLPQAEERLVRLAEKETDFRYRYLLLEPASVLAPKSTAAREIVTRSLVHDKDARLRAKAAESVSARFFKNELARLTHDAEMRVRLAAVTKLGDARMELAGDAIAQRLLTDDWPSVRAAAALALGRFGRSQAWDAALVKSLEDESPAVRRPVLLAIGARGLGFFASEVRARLEDVEEWPRVRAAAAQALGSLCDVESTELLTEYAVALGDPFLDDASRDVAQAALLALVELGPKDLRRRLEPLRQRNVASATRDLATRATKRRGSCRR